MNTLLNSWLMDFPLRVAYLTIIKNTTRLSCVSSNAVSLGERRSISWQNILIFFTYKGQVSPRLHALTHTLLSLFLHQMHHPSELISPNSFNFLVKGTNSIFFMYRQISTPNTDFLGWVYQSFLRVNWRRNCKRFELSRSVLTPDTDIRINNLFLQFKA